MSHQAPNDEIAGLRRRLSEIEAERLALEAQLSRLERAPPAANGAVAATPSPEIDAPTKVALFRKLFAGRTDVFPMRWENPASGRSGYAPACANEWVRGVCEKPRVKCGECPHQAFIPVSDEMIRNHLRGEERSKGKPRAFVAGVYPLLQDSTCWFLAADFDGATWSQDALAYLESCNELNVPAGLERSRSGEGGHVWIFFDHPVAARDARQLGALLMTRTMERRPEIGFDSYDRFFPSQDVMPAGGFGNLIALPLQRRARDLGNSVFVDSTLQAYEDQWAFLASLLRMSRQATESLLAETVKRGHGVFGGMRVPLDDEHAEEPWHLTPSRRITYEPIRESLPPSITLVLSDQIYIDRSQLPPPMIARLLRVAAFQNPDFYRAQALRFSTFDKPRIISCAELHPLHIALPRGCLDDVIDLLASHKVKPLIDDQRDTGVPLQVNFVGELQETQAKALAALEAHDIGVLAATTAFGKTVVAAALLARRGRNTLILVHRRELVAQWVERLKTFLSVDPKDIGVIGGGKRKPTGRIDVALIQSLVRKGEVSDLVAGYGHLIIDECHHLSATSFELVARRSKARYVLGLSATVTRKDGHHPIIFMQCGSVRFRVDAKAQAARRSFEHHVRVRETGFRPPAELDVERPRVPALYSALARDEQRNSLIFDDVLKALEAGRSPVILTERRDHLEDLASRFRGFVKNVVVLRGAMSVKDRRVAEASLRVAEGAERLILATGRYLGEGFDDARLDTLFLTMPISWRGTLAQYVGRLHRNHAGKYEVIVYDYVDSAVPTLARMAAKRQAGYKALGYSIE